MPDNPFYLRVLPIDAPFCGRENELFELISHARANSNVVLYSPRRYGKTSLVKRVQNKLEELGLITIYIDISDASSSEDVASMIARGIYSSLSKEDSVLRKVTGIIKNWRPVFSPDPSATAWKTRTRYRRDGDEQPGRDRDTRGHRRTGCRPDHEHRSRPPRRAGLPTGDPGRKGIPLCDHGRTGHGDPQP